MKHLYLADSDTGLTRPGSYHDRVGPRHAKGPNLRAWQTAIQTLVILRGLRPTFDQQPLPRDTALGYSLHIHLPRPKSHYCKDGKTLNATGRRSASPTTKPDLDNISKATLDALTGIVTHDDAQYTSATTSKNWHPTPIKTVYISLQIY